MGARARARAHEPRRYRPEQMRKNLAAGLHSPAESEEEMEKTCRRGY